MMGMLQQLSFNSASIQFQDDSLTGKALDYAGKHRVCPASKMGQVAQVHAADDARSAGHPCVQQQISAAASAFLEKNPQTFTITARPANPVDQFRMIMGGWPWANPKSLVEPAQRSGDPPTNPVLDVGGGGGRCRNNPQGGCA